MFTLFLSPSIKNPAKQSSLMWGFVNTGSGAASPWLAVVCPRAVSARGGSEMSLATIFREVLNLRGKVLSVLLGPKEVRDLFHLADRRFLSIYSNLYPPSLSSPSSQGFLCLAGVRWRLPELVAGASPQLGCRSRAGMANLELKEDGSCRAA